MSKSGRAAARERIRLERERTARRRQRNRVLIVVGSALGAIVIAVIVILVIRPGQSTGTSTAAVQDAYYNGPFAPVTKNPDHSVTSAQPGGKTPVLAVYEDFQCPSCAWRPAHTACDPAPPARTGPVRRSRWPARRPGRPGCPPGRSGWAVPPGPPGSPGASSSLPR